MLRIIGLVVLILLAWHLLIKPLIEPAAPRDKWPGKKPGNDPGKSTREGDYIDYEEVD
jgi:hypothetical protein